MFWNDAKLIQWAERGGVIPFEEGLINPASIDLRVGKHYRVPTKTGWSASMEIPNEGLVIHPNNLILLHTHEYTKIPVNAVAFIFLKSTIGRRGIEHLHAGYGDPGFEGQWTLEVINHWPHPQLIRKEEPLIQLILCDVLKPYKTYDQTGHYQGQEGPTVPWKKYFPK